MAVIEIVEVRLLGGMRIGMPGGRRVREAELRTNKSADLLRVLALADGKPVSVASLLHRFWPEAEDKRAKASLRTALTHIRTAVTRDAVVRSTAGIALRNVWVDVSAYRMLAADARTCVRTLRHASLVRVAREAEALYVADFEAVDATAPWAWSTREELLSLRKAMLSDAAESAVALRWFRDAVDFAESAVAVDPGLERAYRALMRAYASLGEADRALRAFDRCRRNLALTLGADPSPLTMSVHLEILSAPMPHVPGTQSAGWAAAVATVPAPSRTVPSRRAHGGRHVPHRGVQPMSVDRLAELAQTVLAGQVSPSLLEHLRRVSHGDPLRAVTTLRRWSALGSIVWTSSGLELVTDDSGWDEHPRLSRTVHEMQRHMSPVQAELLQAIAILDRPVTAAELMLLAATRFGLTDTDRMDGAELQALLDQLIDVGALSNTPQGYQLRTLRLRDDTLTWMRPSARRRLHSRLVECNLATEVTLRST